MFRLFSQNEQGSVLVLFAAVLGITMFAAGMTIDYANAVHAKNKLTTAVDAGILAVTKVNLNGQNRQTTFEEVMNAWLQSSNVSFNVKSVNLSVQETLNSVDVTVAVQADVHNAFLSSVGFHFTTINATGVARHESASIEVALVLDVSGSMLKDGRLESLKAAAKLFLDTVMFPDGVKDDQILVGLVPYAGAVALPTDLQPDVPLNMTDLPYFTQADWTGCLKYESSDFDDGLLSRTSYEPVQLHYKWYSDGYWCPGSVVMPLTNDYTALTGAIDTLTVGDGTGTEQGVLWGAKILSPKWRDQFQSSVAGRPLDYTDGTNRKIMVVMTDGAITHHFEPPKADVLAGPGPYKSTGQYHYKKYNAQNYFSTVCDLAKANNVTVYTIGFSVSSNSSLQLLQDCATSLGHHFAPNLTELEASFETIASRLGVPTLTN